MDRSKLKLFFGQLIGFLIIQIAGLLTGLKVFSSVELHQQYASSTISVTTFFLSFTLAFLFIFFLLKIFKNKKRSFKWLFYFLILSTGSLVFFTWFGNMPFSLIVIILAIIIFNFFSIVLIQDALIAICVMGAGVFLGAQLLPWQMIVILLILAIYDLIMVFGTGQMIKMFKQLMTGSLILALVIPDNLKGFKTKITEIETGKGFIFLGTGDFALPMAFMVSSLRTGLLSSIFVLVGSFLGLLVLLLYFLNERKPLPALPPIIIGATLGYLISLI